MQQLQAPSSQVRLSCFLRDAVKKRLGTEPPTHGLSKRKVRAIPNLSVFPLSYGGFQWHKLNCFLLSNFLDLVPGTTDGCQGKQLSVTQLLQ